MGYMGADMAAVSPGDTVVVMGCGPVEVFAQLSTLIRGAATVVAVDLDEGRLEKARVRDCRPLNPGKEDLTEVAKSLTDGRGVDCAIEAVGKPATVQAALESVRSVVRFRLLAWLRVASRFRSIFFRLLWARA